MAKGKLVPLDGVYAVRVFIDDHRYQGAMFCHQQLLEVYILDFNDNLYDCHVNITIQRRIRAIKRFHDDSDLTKAIANDVVIIRKHN
ncbi:hypothetical protein A2Y85_04485 [candidate division WOR-3 bacterium RBG_13_43_14]|uniref:riboflavin kinase n=1 Tax=candidate division WOR-3 bacterium RBG_13_43_14 TaxID=1802590 RepID=A0A1F4U2C0_UNCW3|nr:MAG: hypothetical protein A2Y85_04485 [candidate division WOR-3 bacterium RBG_13_43_14]